MSDYTTSYAIRYSTPALNPQKTEVAVVTAAYQVTNEDPGTPDHANRIAWAHWAIGSSSVAWLAFGWPVSTNPSIVASVTTDPSGQSVADGDVQFVVNSNLQTVIDQWISERPPTGP